MALISCQECKARYSDDAKTCPNCGYTRKKQVGVLGAIFALACAVGILNAILPDNSPKPIPSPLVANVQASPTVVASPKASAPTKPDPDATPNSWKEFRASAHPEDKKNVAAILKMPWHEVCRLWGQASRAKGNPRRLAAYRDFLLSDTSINGVDLMNVDRKRVAIGMTSCGVVAALGRPDKVNNSTTARSQSAQIVYRDRGIYVYTESDPRSGNGIVTAIQN